MATYFIGQAKASTLAAAILWLALSPTTSSAWEQSQPNLTLRSDDKLIELSFVVRDRSSKPVTGLTADDFLVRDKGKQVFSTVEPIQLAMTADPAPATTQPIRTFADAPPAEIWAEIIIPPLSLESRHFALLGALKYVSALPARGVQVAVADASGEILPFTSNVTELNSFLSRLAHLAVVNAYVHPSWFVNAQRLMQEESIRPCVKSAIVFAEDISTATAFMEVARQQGVPLYLADARGLIATVPFGEAATEPEYSSAMHVQNELVRQQLNMFRYVADETGGRVWADNNDLSQVFHLVEDDARGSYLLKLYLSRSKSHRITVSVAHPGWRIIVRPSFTKFSETILAKKTETPSDLLRSDFRKLPLLLTPTVAFFPSYNNGLFMLAVRCKISSRESVPATLPPSALLSVDLSSDYEGSLGVMQNVVQLTSGTGAGSPAAIYDALAKLPAGSYTLTFTLQGEVKNNSDGISPQLLGLRRYRILIHPQMEQPFFVSSLLIGHLAQGPAGPMDVLGVASRPRSILLNNPLNLGGQHFELSPANEISTGEEFSVVAKLYAKEKLKREIRQKWLKSVTVETLAGQTVAGPIAAEIPSDDNDAALAILFRVRLQTITANSSEGPYRVKVELKPSEKSDRTLTLTSLLNIRR